LRGARIGVARSAFGLHPLLDPVMESALAALRRCGAVLVDPVKLPSRGAIGGAEYTRMLHEFKAGLNAYLQSLGPSARVRSLEELIAFNEAHRDRELRWFGQETLVESQRRGGLSDPEYLQAQERCAAWTRELEEALEAGKLDAVVAPTGGPAHVVDRVLGDHGLGGSSGYAAVSGLPSITVPCGDVMGLPVGLFFMGRRWQEGRLLGLAHAFESATRARITPRFLKSDPWEE
jgi:amidase